jgi:hypothetical protein
MTRHWEYLVPVCPSPMGYSVSITEHSENDDEQPVYDLNNDGTPCDIYIVDNIELSLVILMHLRTFIKQHDGIIYCERISASRGRPPYQYDFYGSVIIWTSARVYTMWNHINDIINHYIKKENYDVVTQNSASLWSFFHSGWNIRGDLVATQLHRSVNTQYIDGWMMFNPAYVDHDFNPDYFYDEEQEQKCVDWLDPFRIIRLRVPDLRCTIREKSSFKSSNRELTRMMSVGDNSASNSDNKFIFFVFWPQRKVSF